jgi:transposase
VTPAKRGSRGHGPAALLEWTAPDGIECARLRVVKTTAKGSRPMTIIRIGLDTSKSVFQVHGVDEQERPALRRQLRRGQIEKFFAKLPPTRIGLEACGASHHWGGCCTIWGTRSC